MLFILAMGFYVLLLAALIAYGFAFYGLILASPAILKHATFTTIRIIIPVLIAAFSALFVFSVAIIRGVFVRTGTHPTGIVAHRGHHQTVFTAVREVATKVGAKPLDEIIITPTSEIGVWEETAIYLPPGLGKRKIVLGMGALSFLTLEQFKAVLAHEFGHFSHKDTFFSRFIYRVHAGYGTLIAEMAEVNFYWLNPVFWLMTGYMFVYAIMAASFSRQREFRCDRFAVEAYGRDAYGKALVAAYLGSTFFDEMRMGMALSRGHQLAFDNVYHQAGTQIREWTQANPGSIRKVLGAIMTERTSPMSSHPSLGERLKKQNVPTALVEIPHLPRLVSSIRLDENMAPALLALTKDGPPSAAEELFGEEALKLQADLSQMAAYGGMGRPNR